MKRCALSLTLFLLTFPSLAAADLVTPAGFTESTWLGATASDITGMAWAPDGSGRLFLIRKGGEVRIVQRNPGGTGTLVAAPCVTNTPTYTNNECGLDGMAFDPDFVNNGYVYFFVTVSSSEQQLIRYTVVGNACMDKMPIVTGLATAGQNHNGGGIGFGPDGMLYWGIGDNGNGSGLNDLTTTAGKIGRATRTGGVPVDNPFADGPGGNSDFVWAQNFRNPFTMTFQPTTGLLWVNVVGTNWEQVFVVRESDNAGYNTYENNQPAGFITPIIAYPTNNGAPRTLNITTASRNSNVVTFTTSAAHRLRQGERIVVTGVANGSFNGTLYVLDGANTPGDTTFTAAQNGANEASTGGQLATLVIGRTISGGTFYDATAFPAAYRGNFFFADFNASSTTDGKIVRAAIGTGTTIQTVDLWSNMLDTPIDTSVGPDGALYSASYNGEILRTVATPAGQNIIVSNQHLRMLEGGGTVVTVSLAQAPGGSVTVNAARSAGDTDVTVAAGATLTFTAANWMDPQILRINAAQDSDTPNDTATITVSSTGLASQTVDVEVIDDETQAIVLSSTAVTVNEGANGTFDVSLATAPATAVTVNVARTGGDTDVTVTGGASLMFTPANFATPQTVTVAAADDADNVDDTATITVSTSVAESRTVTITVQEDEDRAPAITSTPVTTATVDAAYTYDVQGNGAPSPTYVLITAPNGMTIDSVTGVISWTPGRTGEFAVTVRAENGVSPDATQMFTITVTGDGSDGGGGCSCRMGQSASDAGGYLAIALLGMVIARRRRAR